MRPVWNTRTSPRPITKEPPGAGSARVGSLSRFRRQATTVSARQATTVSAADRRAVCQSRFCCCIMRASPLRKNRYLVGQYSTTHNPFGAFCGSLALNGPFCRPRIKASPSPWVSKNSRLIATPLIGRLMSDEACLQGTPQARTREGRCAQEMLSRISHRTSGSCAHVAKELLDQVRRIDKTHAESGRLRMTNVPHIGSIIRQRKL